MYKKTLSFIEKRGARNKTIILQGATMDTSHVLHVFSHSPIHDDVPFSLRVLGTLHRHQVTLLRLSLK